MKQILAISCLLLALGGAVSAIKIVKPFPKHVAVIEGSPAVVTCIAQDDGQPPANVTIMREVAGEWKSASVEGRIVQNSTTKGNTTSTTMVIERSELGDDEDQGKYQCEAFSSTGKVEKLAFSVKVIPKINVPVLAVTPAVVDTKTGANVTFFCNLTHPGSLELKMPTWTKDGEMVRSDEHIKVEDESLVLTSVTPKDSGGYACQRVVTLTVDTSTNVTSGIAKLTVTDHPTPTTPVTDHPTPTTPGKAASWEPHRLLVGVTAVAALLCKLFV